MTAPTNWYLVNVSFNKITAPIIATTGSKYKNSAVLVWPIFGMANNCKNKAIA